MAESNPRTRGSVLPAAYVWVEWPAVLALYLPTISEVMFAQGHAYQSCFLSPGEMTGRFGHSCKDTHIAEQRSLLSAEQALHMDATEVIGVKARESGAAGEAASHFPREETGDDPQVSPRGC